MPKKTPPNPYCPVPGCKTKRPHTDDPLVRDLIQLLTPERLALLARTAMAQLAQSISRDIRDKKVFAWYSRLRQPEELYIRVLYALFVARPTEFPHVVSGVTPNGLSAMYVKVNDVVFGGRGMLDVVRPGLHSGSFKPMDMLNMGAHASFAAFGTFFALERHPENLPRDFSEAYAKHLATYCDRLNYVYEMFRNGKSKDDVLAGVVQLHRP